MNRSDTCKKVAHHFLMCVCCEKRGQRVFLFKMKKWHIGKKRVLDKEKTKLSDRIQNIEEKFQSYSQITE